MGNPRIRFERFESLVAEGKTRQEIADILNLNFATVCQIAMAFGFNIRRVPKARKPESERLENEVKRLVYKGLKYREIAEILNIPTQRASHIGRRAGIRRNNTYKAIETDGV